jgi:hypothetical protein
MMTDGTFDDVFDERFKSITLFTQLFSPPQQLLFDVDEEGVWFAVWVEPFLGGLWHSYWVRPDKQRSKAALINFIEVLRTLFEVTNVVVSATKHQHLLDILRKLGYNVGLLVPDLFNKGNGWMIHLHKSQFKYLREVPHDQQIQE